ncbi:organic hydroperoxide resistance transcriptional regulator [Oxobacter pfennigii]|uniref:Organic hydroperoxide resistance transcriptional regulator n=1 Tax=Oxobacter pfennigii TaxID=36849 RepID=A0A0P8WA54_9CLOT|nr:MarR family transcriptional regulator [Oxobacter pfennigii]KPU45487.1 organic hydroperoxide resistance transcriptional regulator [Oxobacter pfennigii]
MNTFKDDTLGSIFFQVMRLHHIRSHTLMGMQKIHRGQPPILGLLWDKDGRTQKEISEELHLQPATVTVMLQRMEKSGLIERRSDSEDLRISRVYLTDKGKQIKDNVEEAIKRLEDECFDGFTIEEKLLLRRFFIHMRDNLLKVSEYKEI